MTVTEVTTRDELTVLKLLARNGNTLGFVSLSTSLPTNAIQAIAERHGWPDRDLIRQSVPQLQEAIDADERRRLMPRATASAIQAQPTPRPAPQRPRIVEAASNPVEKEEPSAVDPDPDLAVERPVKSPNMINTPTTMINSTAVDQDQHRPPVETGYSWTDRYTRAKVMEVRA